MLLNTIYINNLLLVNAQFSSWFPYIDPSHACNSTSKYFDSTIQSCRQCPENQLPDFSVLDGRGNARSCTCAPGYYIVENSCADDNTGNCQGFTCTSCIASGESTYPDNTACVPCEDGVLLGADGYCSCPIGGDFRKEVFVTIDNVGEYLTDSICDTCPEGQLVITQNAKYAGVQYYANPHTCQSCPDEHMSFVTNDSGATFSCECAAGEGINVDTVAVIFILKFVFTYFLILCYVLSTQDIKLLV